MTPRALSPTLSEATQASQMDLGTNAPEKIITRADLKTSLQAYENLLNTSAAYRDALMHMSKATADFADAMEICASLKGTSYLSGSRLLAASGLHHLMGNHWHVLSDSLDKRFERPLRQHLETYRATVAERSATYERALREKSRIIHQTETQNMNLGRKKNRNLQSFREALAVLQRQIEELDELRVSHYQEILEHEEEVWDFVQGQVSLVVRSTLDVIDRFSAKASDPVIEPMLQSIPDPFDSYGPPKTEDQIFSILAPLSIFDNSATPSPKIHSTEVDPSSSFAASPGGASWTDEHDAGGSSASDWADVHTPTPSPPPTAKSAATVIVNRTVSPPSSSRRASYPGSSASSSGSSLPAPAPIRSPSGVRNVASRLRKSLSAISEAASSVSESGGTGSSLRVPSESQSQSEPEMSSTMPNFSFNAHNRESSTETVRQRDLQAKTSLNGLQSAFASEEPVWGSQSTTSRQDEGRGNEETSSSTAVPDERATHSAPADSDVERG
ncbi:uncharacterized protein FOMMEDRAFT_135342 [Fomitiporia mediterranea MF3/22]|uniref:uncharacterized protein n=1 Tax=Fomitiporia mediterranea (strain MF3/22) TaxID=694068 RepID=UPI0004409A4A|nr:uncharacterized protein FOMMEDRAFT_135342 [Fomitiporia mediterranea MF3/22]EJD01081.1 hypothetical protein FOMMEDRAFT_135342 [Fomitiporia mediterranea MF3/22]